MPGQVSLASEVRRNKLLSDQPLDELPPLQGGGRLLAVSQAVGRLSPRVGERHPSPPGAQQLDTEDEAQKQHNPFPRVLAPADIAQHDAPPAHVQSGPVPLLSIQSSCQGLSTSMVRLLCYVYRASTMRSDSVVCFSSFYVVSYLVKALPQLGVRRSS